MSLNAFVCSIAAAISGFLTSIDEPNSLRKAAIIESGIGGDCSIRRSNSIRQIFKKDMESIRSLGFKRSSTQIKRLNLPHEILLTRCASEPCAYRRKLPSVVMIPAIIETPPIASVAKLAALLLSPKMEVRPKLAVPVNVLRIMTGMVIIRSLRLKIFSVRSCIHR